MKMSNVAARTFLVITCIAFSAVLSSGQNQLSPEVASQIDKIAVDALASSGVPSASVVVVKDGKVAYAKAYGDAKLEPKTPAASSMRYSIGSISKQFTAAALLMLQEQGKLSLDDKVGKYIPDLTRANEVTIRQLLSHTSGYQDYWPQDYVMPSMLKPTTARAIMDEWAKKPLDFEPGSTWQYSNTNYVIAGAIIEKVSGMPLMEFLQKKVFAPLKMSSVADIDKARLGDTDPTGYFRYGIGPLHPAPKEGPGWLFAAGELAMTASDLAKWDISIIERSLLKPASYSEFSRDTLLNNGVGTRYGLGVSLGIQNSHHYLSHNGEVSGFTAQNTVFPEDKAAIVVLTNQDAVNASGTIANGIARLLFQSTFASASAKADQAKQIFIGLQKGTVDRSLFTENANAYFNDQALKDFAATLGPLGEPKSVVQTGSSLRGGMTGRSFNLTFTGGRSFRAWTYELPDGKLEQFQVAEN